VAVDADSQVIVAQMLTNQRTDSHHLIPMVEQTETNTSDVVREISTDSGYYSEPNVEHLESIGTRGYIACGRRDKDGIWHGDVGPLGHRMRAEPRRPQITLPATQTNGGTGLRHYQKYSWIPAVFAPRHFERRWRVEPSVYRAQYFEIGQPNAVRHRSGVTSMAQRK